uniref:DUF148 domain-containing protein n=1 Tax=Globodera pallida TaxID=36090 RepID=A0A183C5C0_GLOPA
MKCRVYEVSARVHSLRFILVGLLTTCTISGGKQKESGQQDGALNGLLGGLDFDRMLSGVQELLGKHAGGESADGKKGNGLDKLKEMAANLDPKMLKDILGKMDTEKITETIQNMVKPENIWEMLPAHVKEMLPEGWFLIGKKVGNVLSKEWDKIVELLDGVDTLGSLEELREELKKKAPILADLLENDVWKGNKKRWEKFEANLGEEAKQYTENVKATGWEFLSRKVFAEALRLSPEAKTNLKDSLGNTLPALKPLLEKAATNKKLREWAEQWQMMAELEAMFSKVQLATDGLKEKLAGGGNAGRTQDEEGTKKEEL